MIETSSVFPGKPSVIFGNLRQSLENVRKRSSSLRNNFGKSSEISESGRKSSKNRQRCRYWYVYKINRILHAHLWI